MVALPESQVTWAKTHRIIATQFPPIDVFEDIADPRDWEALASFEAKTNPRIIDDIGNLALIPVERRIGGVGSSWVIAPFTHVSPYRTGRFNDGTFGVYYAGDCFETALFETLHHREKMFRNTNEAPGWIADMREIIGSVNSKLVDIRGGGFDEILDRDDYTKSQEFARIARATNGNGIIYPSVRREGGECIAAFYPDVVSLPVQGQHICLHWNGQRIDKYRELDNQRRIFEIML